MEGDRTKVNHINEDGMAPFFFFFFFFFFVLFFAFKGFAPNVVLKIRQIFCSVDLNSDGTI